MKLNNLETEKKAIVLVGYLAKIIVNYQNNFEYYRDKILGYGSTDVKKTA